MCLCVSPRDNRHRPQPLLALDVITPVLSAVTVFLGCLEIHRSTVLPVKCHWVSGASALPFGGKAPGFLLPAGTCSKGHPGQKLAGLFVLSPTAGLGSPQNPVPALLQALCNAARNLCAIRRLLGDLGCLQVGVGAEQSSGTESILNPCFAGGLIRAPLRAAPASTSAAVIWSALNLRSSLGSDGGHKARGRRDISRTNLCFGYTRMS